MAQRPHLPHADDAGRRHRARGRRRGLERPVDRHERRAPGGDLGPGDRDVDRPSRRWRRRATTTRPRCSCPTAACWSPAAATTRTASAPGQFSAQIYSPPYLFNGPRPTIANAPAATTYGSDITVSTPDAASIRSVNLVSLGADTHQSDMDQHFVPLSFTAGVGIADRAGAGRRPRWPRPAPTCCSSSTTRACRRSRAWSACRARSTAPATPAGADGDRRRRPGDRDLDGSRRRRQPDHELHGDAVHRRDGADAEGRHRQPGRDEHDDHRADQRDAPTPSRSARPTPSARARSRRTPTPVTPAAPVASALAFVQQVNKRGVAASLALQPTAARHHRQPPDRARSASGATARRPRRASPTRPATRTPS